ncbi:MAG: hypothetical protein ABI720_03290 [Actinomycetes bacterium]
MAGIDITEFWCHDCGKDSSFEVVPAEGSDLAREWACTICGAAYIEAVDRAPEVTVEVRVVA